MANNKKKQQVQNWLRNVFTRNHNSRSDGGKRTNKVKEKAMKDYGYQTDVYADDFGDNQRGTKKTVMWCLTAILILLGVLAYIQYNKKKASNAIARVEVLDTISASRVAPMQEMKRQPVQPVQQEVTTVPEPKQQAAEPEKPTKAEPEYAPNGEVLIQMPVYPENGFDSYEEQEEYFKALEEYKKQQKEISDWKIQHGIK